MQDGCRGGKEDPDEGIPFVRMGRFGEGQSREGPSSSLRGRVLLKLSHGGCVGAFPAELIRACM